nr:ATP-binding protein [Sunxiuqinia sp.]
MELYFKKRRWKILLLLAAVLIGAGSLFYTNWLIGQMSIQERKSVELWAEAMKRLVDTEAGGNQDLTFLQTIMENNTTIPIVWTSGDGTILGDRNIKYNEKRREIVLQQELAKMTSQKAPIEIVLSKDVSQYLFYRDSNLLLNLRYFPLVQFGVIMLFISVSYFAFSASRNAEQNQVWVGMSKETAHQLGTPISSLMAWIEILKMKNMDENMIEEIQKDVSRLEQITERFSNIGSAPELLTDDL